MSDSQDTSAPRCDGGRCRSRMGSREFPTFGTLLTLLFVALKLTGRIDWSWWWVFAPVWMTAALMALGIAVIFVGVYLFDAFGGRKRKIRPG